MNGTYYVLLTATEFSCVIQFWVTNGMKLAHERSTYVSHVGIARFSLGPGPPKSARSKALKQQHWMQMIEFCPFCNRSHHEARSGTQASLSTRASSVPSQMEDIHGSGRFGGLASDPPIGAVSSGVGNRGFGSHFPVRLDGPVFAGEFAPTPLESILGTGGMLRCQGGTCFVHYGSHGGVAR